MAAPTIELVHEQHDSDNPALDAGIGIRKHRVSFLRSELYGRFLRFCARAHEVDFDKGNGAAEGAVAVTLAIGLIGGGIAGISMGSWQIFCSVAAAGFLPLAAVLFARLLTIRRYAKTVPAWFNDLLTRRSARHAALRREVAAFDTWAANAEVHPEFAENLVAQADERRKQLRAAVDAELEILDRAIKHHERVQRLVVARKTVDAAFPDPTGRMTTDLVSRLSLLHTAEALSEEAAELGMPTDDLCSLQRDRE